LPGGGDARTIRHVDVRISLEPQAGIDPESVDRLCRQLRNELRSLDVEVVAPPGPEAAQPGARGGGVSSLTEWLVTTGTGGGVFARVVATIRNWLGRRAAGHKVTVTVDGDTLELSGVTPVERAEVVETFVRRHQPA
jgi:hypothetical protein